MSCNKAFLSCKLPLSEFGFPCCVYMSPSLGFRIILFKTGGKDFPMATTNWQLPSTATGIKSCAAAGGDFQLSPERNSSWRAETRHFLLWEYQKNRSSDRFFLSPHIQKSTNILLGSDYSLWIAVTFTRLAESFCKKYVLDHMYSPFLKITHMLTFPLYLFGVIS